MKSQSILLLIILVALCFLAGCKKFAEVEAPKDRVIADRVFTTDAKATSAVTAIYGNIINGGASFANSLTTVAASMSADELLKFNPTSTEAEIATNEITTVNSTVATIWKSAYAVIYQANAVLEGLSASTSLSPSVKAGLTGEAKFIRAFCYAYLTAFYGDVPLVTATDYGANATLSRTGNIYPFVVAELQEAKNLLPEAYAGGEKARPTKWAAAALLARIYLYTGAWQGAEGEATAVLNTNLYTPLQSLSSVFLKNSKEAIWQLSPQNGLLRETSLFRPSGTPAAPQYYFYPAFTAAFDPADGRRTKWMDSVTYFNVKYLYPGKYKNGTATVTEYYTVLRAAETLLIRAEARAQGGNLTGAIDDLNAVRGRAGLSALPNTLNAAGVMAALQSERRAELFAEWGHRWFDLIRWNKAGAILSPIKPTWQITDQLYPIPQDEMATNSSLTQNPGY